MAEEIPEREYNLMYSSFCFIMLVCSYISSIWSRKILSPMYGFEVQGLQTDPKYKINAPGEGGIHDLTGDTYGTIQGPGIAPYAVLLLFAGQVADTYNRKLILFSTCILWSATSFACSFADSYSFLLAAKLL